MDEYIITNILVIRDLQIGLRCYRVGSSSASLFKKWIIYAKNVSLFLLEFEIAKPLAKDAVRVVLLVLEVLAHVVI